MEIIKLHNDFRLNGISFSSIESLINYTLKNEIASHPFLIELFNDKSFIEVKTSGSTGKPKNIQLLKNHLVNSAIATGNYFNLKENTSALLCLSPNYIAGKMMLVRSIVLGWHLTIIEPKSNPLNGNEFYDFTAMVPLQVQSSLTNLHKIKQLIIGGGAVSDELQSKLQNLKTKIYATYGMTETVTHIAIKKLNHCKIESNFEVLSNIKISTDSRDCLVINAPKITNQTIITNDIVELISDNSFKWLGRFDNVINTGGIKVIPEEVEKKIAKIITTDFFISSIKDEKLGEKIILIVEGDEIQHSKLNIQNFKISKFKKPKEIYFIPEFVRTSTNKINRKSTLKLLHF